MRQQNPASCNRWADKLMVRADALSVEEQNALQEHLDTCQHCREQYTISQRLAADLRQLSGRLQPLEQQQRLQQIKLYHARKEKENAPVLELCLSSCQQMRDGNEATAFRSRLNTDPSLHTLRVQRMPLSKRHVRLVPTNFTRFFDTSRKHHTLFSGRALSFIAIIAAIILTVSIFSPVQAGSLILQPQAPKPPHNGPSWVHHVSWSANGKDIASLWDDNTMQVWNADNGKESFKIKVGWGAGLAFSPNDGKYLASISTDGTIQILDVATCKASTSKCQQQAIIYSGHSDQINALAWSPDGSKIVSASNDHTVQVWDAHTGQRLYTYQDPTSRGEFTAVAWSPDGKRIVSGDENGHVQVWDALTGKNPLSYSGHIGDPITSLSWSPDSQYIVSSGYRGIAHVWNAQTGETSLLLSSSGSTNSAIGKQNDPIYAAEWSPRDPWLIALASHDTIQVCNAITGEQIAVYHPSKDHHDSDASDVFTVAWSPDDRHIVSGGPGFVLTLHLG